MDLNEVPYKRLDVNDRTIVKFWLKFSNLII